MKQNSSLLVGARVAILVLAMLSGLGLGSNAAWASHLRAGDIQVKADTTAARNPRRFFFKMVLYTDLIGRGSGGVVTQPAVTIFFGDGTSSGRDAIPRSTPNALPIAGNTDTGLNIYYFEHTYPSTGSFTVSFIGENRNDGVLNMDLPGGQTFYIRTTFTISPSFPGNHSPVLRAPAVDRAATGQVFLHNPAAFDADGDSLSYQLRTCQQAPAGVDGTLSPIGNNRPDTVVCTNYRYPNNPSLTPGNPPIQVAYNGFPAGVPGAPAIFVQDNVMNRGTITWNAPVAVGFYNVAMVVREWRRTPLGFAMIGEVVRDMQIIVSATANLRPTLTIPADICVIAGTPVTGVVTATDGTGPNTTQTAITLFAYAGIIPPATFVQNLTGPPTARGTFTWQTQCNNVARLPYQVVFKAQDTPSGPITATNPPLIDEKVWKITVVGPAPQNLQATPVVGTGSNPNTVNLSWNTYACGNADSIYIYRKINPSSFVPGPCITGIPASAGYTRIGAVVASATTFNDRNVAANGTVLGLDRGQTYCYRIFAGFPLPAGGASIASQETCATFPGSAARLIKVDVTTTAVATGQIQVCWTRPRSAPGTVLDGTPSYVLSRAVGLAPAAAAFAPIATIPSLTDTCYTDTNLNTEALQYTYQLEYVRTFPAGDNRTPVREVSPVASSVRTSALPNATATQINVSWTYNVPWTNVPRPVVIYRRTGGTGNFTQVGTAATTATGGTFTDADPTLRKGETYCYYVLTNGQYLNVSYLNSLLNRSQIRCVELNTPPCTPVLALAATNCDSLAGLPQFPTAGQRYANRLRWAPSNSPTGCDAAVANYRLYYRPGPTGPFTLIATTLQTSYVHQDLAFSGGCYAVQAVAPSGAVSDTSNVACQDNCLFFVLPNIFTPNGDGRNAVFRPKNFSPVRSVRFQAFNRWGVKVFSNTTTSSDAVLINWDGGGPVGEVGNGLAGKVSDGIYYYLAEVEFADFANTKRTFKGWVEIIR